MTNQITRREWCAALSKLVSPSFPEEAQAALLAMLPALKHLPDSLFNPHTLTEVAMARRRQAVPAFDEIIRALNEYRKTYLPDPTLRLASRPNADLPPDRAPPSPEAVAVVSELLASWQVEMAQKRQERLEQEALLRPMPPPMRDVTLKGDDLRRSREARGLKVPV